MVFFTSWMKSFKKYKSWTIDQMFLIRGEEKGLIVKDLFQQNVWLIIQP